MALRFIAIDPETDTNHCPAVFIDESTGDLLFQGWTVTDPTVIAMCARSFEAVWERAVPHADYRLP